MNFDNKSPELIFGIVGPIGVNLDVVQSKLNNALKNVDYDPQFFQVTTLMEKISTDVTLDKTLNPLKQYDTKIRYANSVRKKCQNDAALAALAMLAINLYRKEQIQGPSTDTSRPTPPIPKTAYIIRQFKRKEEIKLMREVYGKKFILISVYTPEKARVENLINKFAKKNPDLPAPEIERLANELIKRDYDEAAVPHGQGVANAFHLGDVFVNAKSERTIEETIYRFIEALFGKNSISPNKDEYGAYIAASASLRSIDSSRQVGAAIFTEKGEIISLGANEVPSPGGGTYWTEDSEPHRDFDDKREANSLKKNRISYDFLKRLYESKLLNLDNFDQAEFRDIMSNDLLSDALINDITEYGRMVHAEMNAVTDAARMGRSTKSSTLFCTTFPCHNCAKHIVAAGIGRVVFIEPYPKSQAISLHGDSICLDETDGEKVIFQNFVGISPTRYKDIFKKGKRKNSSGDFEDWSDGCPIPRIQDYGSGYVITEEAAISSVLEKVIEEVVPE